MSIYPVRLSEWFPFGDEMREILVSIVNSTRCLACGDRVRLNKAVGHHSLCWGNGDLWCSWKCCKSGKVARPDKRRERRLRRMYKDSDQFIKVLMENL
jgi:hypothetical protein